MGIVVGLTMNFLFGMWTYLLASPWSGSCFLQRFRPDPNSLVDRGSDIRST